MAKSFNTGLENVPMRVVPKLTAVALGVTLLTTGAASANSLSERAESGDLRAKIGYCTNCHGVSARGYYGYYTMPRLAGQNAEYIVNQLNAFAERRRTGGFPFRLSRIHAVSPQLRSALGEHFSHLHIGTLGGGRADLVATGRRLYTEGAPEANVPACVTCHGPEAQGAGPIARLAGQLFKYTRKQLLNWSTDRIPDPALAEKLGVMRPVARSLSKTQIDALASYLNWLK